MSPIGMYKITSWYKEVFLSKYSYKWVKCDRALSLLYSDL